MILKGEREGPLQMMDMLGGRRGVGRGQGRGGGEERRQQDIDQKI